MTTKNQRNERTSSKVASKAARLAKIHQSDIMHAAVERLARLYLATPDDQLDDGLDILAADIRLVAASALTQAPTRKKR